MAKVSQPLVLTQEELGDLTGTVQPKRMVAWLNDRGWVFEAPARRGDTPKVDRSYYLAKMSGQESAAPREKPRLAMFGRK